MKTFTKPSAISFVFALLISSNGFVQADELSNIAPLGGGVAASAKHCSSPNSDQILSNALSRIAVATVTIPKEIVKSNVEGAQLVCAGGALAIQGDSFIARTPSSRIAIGAMTLFGAPIVPLYASFKGLKDGLREANSIQ